MARFELDCVLAVQLGPVDREWQARIVYRGGPFQADIQAIELRIADSWIRVPWLIDLVQDCDALFDALRAHASGRSVDEQAVAATLRGS